MKSAPLFLLCFWCLAHSITAQTTHAYTTAQAHSHNDYEQKRPFTEAYDQQFGSVEVDLFLVNDTLFAAHNLKDISSKRTFASLYLHPILDKIHKNGGQIYTQKDIPFQLLIDLKTTGEATLAALIKELEPHKEFLAPTGTVHIVISGNVPAPELFENYPPYISFDGRPEITYSPAQLSRIGLISQSFQKYSKWNGEGPLTEKEKKNISNVVKTAHDLGKKVRLWATPDNINSWKCLMSIHVDYLNTDKVKEMGDYLRTAPRK